MGSQESTRARASVDINLHGYVSNRIGLCALCAYDRNFSILVRFFFFCFLSFRKKKTVITAYLFPTDPLMVPFAGDARFVADFPHYNTLFLVFFFFSSNRKYLSQVISLSCAILVQRNDKNMCLLLFR